MNYICILFGLVFYCVGILFAFSSLYSRLSIWEVLSKEEQSEIKVVPLCKNIGFMIGLSGTVFLLKGLLVDMNNQLFTILMVIWFIIAGIDVLYIEKGNRYKNKSSA